MLGSQALVRLKEYNVNSVLDIGSGEGLQAQAMRDMGMHVDTIDMKSEAADIEADYLTYDVGEDTYDCYWCCHVLEHQRNPGSFLEKMVWDAPERALLAITVPPLKQNIVGGHVTLWNAGLLLYHLVLAGIDCSKARVGHYGYNISVLVENTPRPQVEGLTMGKGDLEKLAQYFPVDVKQGFCGQLQNVNW